MPVTVRGTDILFNNGTTQSTAAGPPTTAQVLAATAGASAGDVGSYALLRAMNFQLAVNATFAGSNLRFGGMGFGTNTGSNNSRGSARGAAPAGTWRAMGFASGLGLGDVDPSTLMLRIS